MGLPRNGKVSSRVGKANRQRDGRRRNRAGKASRSRKTTSSGRFCAPCCVVFRVGIVSIVYSTKVSGLWAQGRYAEAQAAADSAKKWAIIGAIVGAVVAVISVILYVFIGVIAISNLPSTTTTTYSGY